MSSSNPLLKSLIDNKNTLQGVNSDGSPISVVVADDEVSHRKIISQILRSIGCNVLGEAKDGEEAVYMYNLHRPQLMTLDYHMPRMEGIVALFEIRKINPNAVVVMTTSENHINLVREVFKRGAADYILKPFGRATFIEKIEKVIVQQVRGKSHNQVLGAAEISPGAEPEVSIKQAEPVIPGEAASAESSQTDSASAPASGTATEAESAAAVNDAPTVTPAKPEDQQKA